REMSRGDASDLLCRARREELSGEEHRRLEGLLESSAEARLMSAMLSEFERESQVRAGDDVLLARIGARALRKSGGGFGEAPFGRRLTVRLRSRVALLVAAAVLLVGSIAFGWRLTVSRRAASTPAPATSMQTPTSQSIVRAQTRKLDPPRVEEATALDVTPLQEHAAPLTTTRKSAARPAPSAPVNGRSNEASELFANANLLRRQGNNDEAARMYQQLISEYSQSREAAPARLALGKLLRGRDPARALVQFRVLAEQRGALRPEALWGMAEASRSLGQSAVESRALDDLVREFPDSPYADAARARIADGAR
ncbi:MAG TPA: tetratricopeptide repeat protein, partial [Polyangiaceae bacterium]|nr:tetratricopeptide repeat protein [Polyangiaceae bacterium]